MRGFTLVILPNLRIQAAQPGSPQRCQAHWLKAVGHLIVCWLLTLQASTLTAASPQVAVGSGHSLLLQSDGTVWAAGFNSAGQLGDGTTINRAKPVKVQGLTDVTAVAAGAWHSLFLKMDGTVWAAGQNTSGQLGNGSTSEGDWTVAVSIPVQVKGLEGVKAIAAAGAHSLFLKADGTVLAAGDNGAGQLGDGSQEPFRSLPVRVAGLTDITAMATGSAYSLFLKSDGTVFAAGSNGYGAFGNGGSHTEEVHTAVQVTGLANVTALAAGYDHSLFLLKDGTVLATGNNENGELGDGTLTTRSTARPVSGLPPVSGIAAGGWFSLFRLADGRVFSAGDNSSGQLGDGSLTDRSIPVELTGLAPVNTMAAGASDSLFVAKDGSILASGSNRYGAHGDGSQGYRDKPLPVPGMSGVLAIAAGAAHSLFLKTDGTVWSVGENHNGQLGDGTRLDRTTPVRILTGVKGMAGGWNHSVFLKEDGTVQATGSNEYGQPLSSGMETRTTPSQVENLTGVQSVISGDLHTIYLRGNGSVMTAGDNWRAQLGAGSLALEQPIPVTIPDLTGVVAAAAGGGHGLFLRADGSVCGTGPGGYGELGTGGTELHRFLRIIPGLAEIKAIGAGQHHSLFLTAAGRVQSCGSNISGQLGDGTFADRAVPVSLPQPDNVKAVEAGRDFSLFLTADGTVWAAGDNTSGQFGNGTTAVTTRPVRGPEGVLAVAAGGDHTLFLKSDGTVEACGANYSGQLGIPRAIKTTPAPAFLDTRIIVSPWQTEQFGAQATDLLIADWTADPDHDGLPNLLERAFNLPPLQPGTPIFSEGNGKSGLPATALETGPGGPGLVMRFVRLKTAGESGLTYTPEFCSDPTSPGGWTAAASPETVVSIDQDWELVTVRDTALSFGGKDPNTNTSRFGRVRVNLSPPG